MEAAAELQVPSESNFHLLANSTKLRHPPEHHALEHPNISLIGHAFPLLIKQEVVVEKE